MNDSLPNHGHDGADKSSNTFTADGIHSPENTSYQQSLYIAAISTSLGYAGLVSPVTDTQDGVEYEFDFYLPDEQQLFKVFHGFDVERYEHYAAHPGQPILIFDSSTIPCKIEICECGCGDLLVVNKKIAKVIHENPRVLIYNEGHFWEYFMHLNGKWIWKKKMPFLVREILDCREDIDADEFDEDEED